MVYIKNVIIKNLHSKYHKTKATGVLHFILVTTIWFPTSNSSQGVGERNVYLNCPEKCFICRKWVSYRYFSHTDVTTACSVCKTACNKQVAENLYELGRC